MLLGDGYGSETRVRDKARALVAGGGPVRLVAGDRDRRSLLRENAKKPCVLRSAFRTTRGRDPGRTVLPGAFVARAVAAAPVRGVRLTAPAAGFDPVAPRRCACSRTWKNAAGRGVPAIPEAIAARRLAP